MSLRRTLNLLRIFFLGLCIAAIGARVAWTKYPDQVDRVDNWIVRTAEHRVRRELNRARTAKEAGKNEVALEHLLNVAESTDEIKHGDRLEGLREMALTYLRDEYRRLGQLEESMRWADELHELNERNTMNELARAKLLGELGQFEEPVVQVEPIEYDEYGKILNPPPPTMTEKSIALFARLDDLTEGRAVVELPYLEQLVRAEQGTDALELLLRMKEGSGLDLPLDGWELRYRVPGTAWSDAVFIDLDGEGVPSGSVALEVPAEGFREVRLDVPRGASVIGKRPMLELSLSDGASVTVHLGNLQRLNQLEAIEEGFRGVSMSDPYLVFDVPELAGDVTVTGATLQLELLPVMPERVRSFLESDLGAAALKELESRYQAEGASASSLARLQKLKDVLHD